MGKLNLYRQLQRHLDKMPVPFPETESGVEIRLLKHLFDEAEAGIALNLSALPNSVDKIYNRFKKGTITKEHLVDKLNGLYVKGAILRVPDPRGGFKYSKIPLAIGMFEHQVDRITREFAEDFFRYEDEGFSEAFLQTKTRQMRTIPVNLSVEPEFLVGSYDNIRVLIDQSEGPFAVMNCVCRQARDKMGERCKQTDIMETCFTIGKSALYMIAKGVARKLNKAEITKLFNRAEKEGMVLQPENTQNPGFICCCCGCCCGVLSAAKKFPRPAEFLESNYLAKVDPELCTACDVCKEYCQMDALVSENNHTEVLDSHCIGCGVCLQACSSEAITLRRTETKSTPPKETGDMYKKMMVERYGALGSLKIIGKAALGKKI